MSGERRVVVIGAGMGGLAAALGLARHGHRVVVVEARDGPGGLAADVSAGGLRFDGGPYVLLDRRGLEWAFERLGLDLAEHVRLRRINEVYEVASAAAPAVRIDDSLAETSARLESQWTGAGALYRRFVERMSEIRRRLEPLRWSARPGAWELLRSGAWRDVPFLLSPLGRCLDRSRLPRPIRDAIGIWTHVAGQRMATAPSPLALVPVLIHEDGAYSPEGGMETIPRALEAAGRAAGVEFRYGTKVRAVTSEGGAVSGVVTEEDERIAADVVVSNVGGLGTYLGLATDVPERARDRLRALPRQSPGVCVYLKVRGRPRPPYLRFHLPGEGSLCRLLITPAAVSPCANDDGWWPARLMAPMDYDDAEDGGRTRQDELVQSVLEETWWREHFEESEVVATRTPRQWGAEHHLWANSMNPVMTARLMRSGRLPHRSPHLRGLYLAGSSTHPGQWVSFCAISGIFAAARVCEEFA